MRLNERAYTDFILNFCFLKKILGSTLYVKRHFVFRSPYTLSVFCYFLVSFEEKIGGGTLWSRSGLSERLFLFLFFSLRVCVCLYVCFLLALLCLLVSHLKNETWLRKMLVKQNLKKKVCPIKEWRKKFCLLFFSQIINRYLMVKKREKQILGGGENYKRHVWKHIRAGGGIVCACGDADELRWWTLIIFLFSFFLPFDESGKHCEINFFFFYIGGGGGNYYSGETGMCGSE